MLNRGIISNINDNCLLRHSPSLLRLTARSSSFLKPRYSRFQDPEVHWGLSPLCGQLLYLWIFLFLKILPYITRQVQNVLFFFFLPSSCIHREKDFLCAIENNWKRRPLQFPVLSESGFQDISPCKT